MKRTPPHPLHPLRRQVVALFSALLASLFGLTFGTIYFTTRADFLTHLDSDLVALARTELASALDGPGRGPHLHVAGGPQKGVLFRLDGTVLASSPGLTLVEIEKLKTVGLNLQAQPQAQQAVQTQNPGNRFTNISGEQGPERVLLTPAKLGEFGTAFLVLSAPLAPIERDLSDLKFTLLVVGFLGTTSGVVLATFVAQRLTRELESTADLAARVSQGQIAERMRPSHQSSEIHDLQNAINRMLDSLQAREVQHRQFVADASHELRSPIQALRGTLEVSMRRPRNCEEYVSTLQIALSETLRLQKLSEQLLLLAQADLGRLELHMGEVDLAELLQDCLAAKSGQAQQKGVQLHLRATPLTIKLDSDRIRQCIHNLLDNAIRYTPAGSPIEIDLTENGPEVVLTVHDQGPGLTLPDSAQGDPNWLFERFTRLDPSRQRSSGNMGLGLAITKEILEAHGGTISVRASAFTTGQPNHPAPGVTPPTSGVAQPTPVLAQNASAVAGTTFELRLPKGSLAQDLSSNSGTS